MISIKGLDKYFNKGKQNEIHVINNVTLELPERGMVAVFGKSGCGKTTLLNVLGGLDGYSSGTVEIDGKSIAKNTDDIRNRYVGYIFQNYNLSKDETCYDNVAAALRLVGITDEAVIEERVNAALKNVGMDKYAKRKPDTLSGGQQQRIAIARAIVKNPRIILADEPTGNLDETNTVLIMNLLRAIAKDHLVILVTHEAKLVDYYCDKVIELADGEIKSIRDNATPLGFSGRDKNGIYLGELERSEHESELLDVEYYGERPDFPIKIRIINDGAKVYISLGTPKIEIVDDTSEIKIYEGIFEQKDTSDGVDEIDMSKLPPVTGKKVGNLFNLRSSLISGYAANFKRHKRSIKTLRRCMFLFALSIVIMACTFGSAFRDLMMAKDAYSHNTFYVYTPNKEASDKLLRAVEDESTGVDFIRTQGPYGFSDFSASFRLGMFETFELSAFDSDFYTNAVLLDTTVAKGLELVAGSNEGLKDDEILISTKMADALLEKSYVGYISSYSDLIGLLSTNISFDGRSARIAGVVRSDESAVYMSEIAMAKHVKRTLPESNTVLAGDFDMTLDSGKTVLIRGMGTDDNGYPAKGDVITVQGLPLEVTDIVISYLKYSDWLSGNGHTKLDIDAYFAERTSVEFPELIEGSEEYKAKAAELKNSYYFEYYDYYYTELDAFLRSRYLYTADMDLWLYFEKGKSEMRYTYYESDYYKAVKYKEINGHYPTKAEFDLVSDKLPGIDDLKNEAYYNYENEYYSTIHSRGITIPSYVVSESDYVTLSKRVGETHKSALAGTITESGNMSDTFTVVHSTAPALTEAWLRREFSDITHEYHETMITPADVYEGIIRDRREEIVGSVISLVVMMAIMSLCMYFIMRSSMMNRIKEIGIYRAIGVSKRNLVFRFLIEAAVLAAMTVLLGYIAITAFIYIGYSISPLVSELLFYPIWYALVVLALILGITLICGILPIVFLLRKTPSEILAKYDI